MFTDLDSAIWGIQNDEDSAFDNSESALFVIEW